MEAILRQFREAAAGIEPGAGRKFPKEMRALGGEYARSRRAEGASWSAIADELGVIAPTIQRWAERVESAPGTFHQVRLEPAAKSNYTAVLPGGLRIEGLELDAIVALARALS